MCIRDRLKAELKSDGIEVESFNASLLFEPWEVKNLSGAYFKVFTPFWKKCQEIGVERLPLPKPNITSHNFSNLGVELSALNLLPTSPDSVSYTHLDVYKRQVEICV